MKTVFLSAAVASLLVSSALAQNLPQPARASVPPGTIPAGESSDAPRFDLKFPGGNVKEFVAAVSKALGKPVNVIVPKESEETQIPALDVSRVTVRDLFRALSNASKREVAVPVNIQSTGSPQGILTNTSVQYKIVSFIFNIEEPYPSPDAVWSFLATNPPVIPTAEPVTPPRTVQYYPVAEYLSHFTVEDITAAIESGWALQGGAAQPPATIRFHEETKLLICAGTATQIELIPQVLKGLSQMLRYPRSENLPITRRARQIIIPKLVFQEASVTEAVDYVRRKAAELDPQHQGFNIVVRLGEGAPERKITLALSEVPALQVLKYIAELGGLELETGDHAIVLSGRPSPVGAAPRIMPPPSPFVPTPLPSAALPNPPGK